MAKAAKGVTARHARSCRSRSGGNCNCDPSYEAWVFSARDGKKIRETFAGKGALTAAKNWRSDAAKPAREGVLRPTSKITLREAADAWLAGARSGEIRKRGGATYAPSAIRGYGTSLRLRVLDDLGPVKLGEIRRVDLQDLIDRLVAAGSDASTVRNTIVALQPIFRRALSRNEITVNPARGLELPKVEGRRDRIADPKEAAQLLAALGDDDRALWATAVYAGLRRGELLALRWEDVDRDGGIIHVERSWDMQTGPVRPKSTAGTRKVPILAPLGKALAEHKLRSTWADGLVFGRTSTRPFDPMSVATRARAAWSKAELASIGLHECRHSYASMMIAAGVNAKALSTFMGHASISITLDRYGHLFPGSEAEAAKLADKYITKATGAQTGAQGQSGA